jgi:hypothetical protein
MIAAGRLGAVLMAIVFGLSGCVPFGPEFPYAHSRNADGNIRYAFHVANPEPGGVIARFRELPTGVLQIAGGYGNARITYRADQVEGGVIEALARDVCATGALSPSDIVLERGMLGQVARFACV